jgi:hypothetical protein
MSFFSGLLRGAGRVLDPNRLAMAQAFVEGDYGAAAALAQRFRQLQEEHERVRRGTWREQAPKAGLISETPMPAGFENMDDLIEPLGSVFGAEPLADPQPDMTFAAFQEGFDRQQEHDIARRRARETGRDWRDVLREMRGLPPVDSSTEEGSVAPIQTPQIPAPGQKPGKPAFQPMSPTHRDPTGDLSATFESNSDPSIVSSGRNDRPSAGQWQITDVNIPHFLASGHGRPWARELRGLRPGTPQFETAWRRITQREPQAFENAQYKFLYEASYWPAVTRVAKGRAGLDFSRLPATLREAAWSTAIHHGAAPRLLESAVVGADRQYSRTDPRYGEALIRSIYRERIQHVTDEARRNPSRRRIFMNIATGRLPREMNEALRRYQAEQRR